MKIFKAKNGDGSIAKQRCPILKASGVDSWPAISTKGWRAINVGCCTVLDEGDFTITITGSLFGKGAVTVLVVTCVGSLDCVVHQFKLKGDYWPKQLPQINAEIEKAFGAYLKKSGWL